MRGVVLAALAVVLLAVDASANRISFRHGATGPTHSLRPGNLINLPSLAVIGSNARTQNCVATPAEYVQAFKNREQRCVSKDLIGRISQGFDPTTGRGFPLDVSKRAAYFFTGSDALEKFLRIGFPLTVGDFVEDLSTGDFPGLQQVSNGQAFLESVGFSATDVDISTLYTLNIFSRSAVTRTIVSPFTNRITAFDADIPPVHPTWEVVRNFMEDTFKKQDLQIPDKVVEILDSQSFGQLTSCPAECSYSPVDFPSPTLTKAVLRGTRTGINTCDAPTGFAPGALIQVEPTSLDPTSNLCSPLWQQYYTKYSGLFTTYSCNSPRGTPDDILNANLAKVAEILAADIAAASSDLEKTIIFRAFLIQNCGGAFNPLFSGDGLTVTGFGGLLSPTSPELIVSPFVEADVSSSKKAAIPFCINGQNGGMPNPDGSCALVV